ncbi:MAG: glucose-6-phosphate dehydrogenase [Alphaproteobacteria bacterium]|nr:glucose-6-phosphate dehydrogenase [Alphaproteobacteria bacterium]
MSSPPLIVIFGATGDLAQRMLYPSLYFLSAEKLIPDDIVIVGCSRSDISDEAFAGRIAKSVRLRAGDGFDDFAFKKLSPRLRHARVDANDPSSFENLAPFVDQASQVLYYLSTSPRHYAQICANLMSAGLTGSEARVIVEKPLGHDLKTCAAINDCLAITFGEENVLRIDHYLGKEAVQNLLALRFANTFFEPLWNKVSIEHVQITVAESIGVEDRFGYYDEYGALRDMVQNHVLQLLCLVAMEPPASLDPDSVRNEKVKVLRSLRRFEGRDIERKTVRGQYRAGVSDGKSVPGYTEEANGHPSGTETFVALAANIDNWRWAGVPFYLRTGKRLALRRSEIVIQFRPVPHSIFPGSDLLANRLTIRLQPEEDISLLLMNKTPSLAQNGMELKPLGLNLSLVSLAGAATRRRIAYERLLLEALAGKSTLFVRRDEAEAAWEWIDHIAAAWAQGSAPTSYSAGSWGPPGVFALTERNGHSWYE